MALRYLYKIYSNYDGFKPKRIPDRLVGGRTLELGWEKYIDALHERDEVWVIFKGTGFKKGVYIRGLVETIDADQNRVFLRVRDYSTNDPLTDDATSEALLAVVAPRRRQVFLWPVDRELRDRCEAKDCEDRQCLACDVFAGIPQINGAHYVAPRALRGHQVIPAYWIIPPRCFLYRNGRQPAPWIRRVTEMFASFKVGEKAYAFPLAVGIYRALRTRNVSGFDAIIPVPLSPEKKMAGELERTRELANELSKLIGVRVADYLSLSEPISKRRMHAQGFTKTEFKAKYRRLLNVDDAIVGCHRILLVDDVITFGSTTSVIIAKLQSLYPKLEIVVAAAGQMAIQEAVSDQNGPAW